MQMAALRRYLVPRVAISNIASASMLSRLCGRCSIRGWPLARSDPLQLWTSNESWKSAHAATPLRCGVTAAAPATVPSISVPMLDRVTSLEFLKDVDTLLFDCDGVLWKGSDLVPGAAEALMEFRRQGKRLLFVTNNASKSRAKYVQKFLSLGLDVQSSEIVSASYAVAAYLQSTGFSKKVFLIGNQGVEEELTQHGIQYVGGEAMQLPHMGEMDAIKSLQVDPDIGAVVVGWDPNFSYSRLVYASVCLREIPGCFFVATNTDCADSLGGQRMMPGTGGLVAAVEVASGVKPLVVGKEGPWLLTHLAELYGLQPSKTCMIGDRLDTDIAMGRAGSLRTVLTLTGISTLADAQAAAAAGEGPDAAVESVAVLAGL